MKKLCLLAFICVFSMTGYSHAATETLISEAVLDGFVGGDGSVNTNGIEFIIQKEEDGQWRVGQERILPDDELDSDKRRGAL